MCISCCLLGISWLSVISFSSPYGDHHSQPFHYLILVRHLHFLFCCSSLICLFFPILSVLFTTFIQSSLSCPINPTPSRKTRSTSVSTSCSHSCSPRMMSFHLSEPPFCSRPTNQHGNLRRKTKATLSGAAQESKFPASFFPCVATDFQQHS